VTLVPGVDEGVLQSPDEPGETSVRTRVGADRTHSEVGVIRTSRE